MPSSVVVGLAIACVALAACSSAGGGPAASAPDPTPVPTSAVSTAPGGSDQVVLRLEYRGGLVAPTQAVSAMPAIAVYEDGRVFTPGAQIMIYPGPILPAIAVRRLTADGLARLIAAAKEAGLDRDAQLAGNRVPDAASTVFTTNLSGTRHEVSVDGLLEGAGGPDADAIAKIARFLSMVTTDFDAAFGPDLHDVPGWQPAALRLLVGPANREPEAPQQPVAWPLAIPLASAGTAIGGFRCVDVTGSDVATLMPVLRRANALTPFTQGSDAFGLVVRPLLPGESGCDGVAG